MVLLLCKLVGRSISSPPSKRFCSSSLFYTPQLVRRSSTVETKEWMISSRIKTSTFGSLQNLACQSRSLRPLPTFNRYENMTTRQFGTSRRSKKRRRYNPKKYRAFHIMRKHALRGVRFPLEARLSEMAMERKKQTLPRRPQQLFGVSSKDLFLPIEENSVKMDQITDHQEIEREEISDGVVSSFNGGSNEVEERAYQLYEETTEIKEKKETKEKSDGMADEESSTTIRGLDTKLSEADSHLSDIADTLFKELAELQTFRQFKLRAEVQTALLKARLTTPTELQQLAIPKLLEGTSSLVVGPTGSGKTAAYLLPLVSRLFDSDKENLAPFPGRPRLIILCPTQELVEQTAKVVRFLVPRSTGLRLGGSSLRITGGALHAGQDVVVATPMRLLTHFSRGELRLNKVESVVVDEADLMCAPPLDEETLRVLKLIKIRNSREMGKMKPIDDLDRITKSINNNLMIKSKDVKKPKTTKPLDEDMIDSSPYDTSTYDDPTHSLPQIVFATAVKTAALTHFMDKHLAGLMIPVISIAAHLIGSQVQQVFVPVKDKSRMQRLFEILEETKAGKLQGDLVSDKSGCQIAETAFGDSNQTIVFANSIKVCAYVGRQLKMSGYDATMMHGDLDTRERSLNYKSFLAKKTKILVATNIASRGLDIPSVGNVIMFNCPRTTADYIHRAGRVSRAGHAGRVSTIYCRRDHDVIKEIQNASRAGRALDVRDPSKTLKRALLSHRNWQLEVAAKSKAPSKRILGALGISHKRWAGPKKKWLMKKEYFRYKDLIEQKRLYKKGVLPKDGPFPGFHDVTVEQSESKTFLKMVRGSDGLLQALPIKKQEFKSQRRRLERQAEASRGPAQGAARPSVSPGKAQKLMEMVKSRTIRSEF